LQFEPTTTGVTPEAAAYAAQSRAPATRRAYLNDTGRFAVWCVERGLSSLPASAETVANFLSWMAGSGFKSATIERNLVAISVAHSQVGVDSPRHCRLVRDVLRGIRRNLGVAPTRKRALMTSDVAAMLATTTGGVKGIRDRAILCLAFSAALRRGELVALDVSDFEFSRDGVLLRIRRSKGDQDGAGAVVGVPHGMSPDTCPVRQVRAWLATAGIAAGPVFRSVDRHGHVSGKRLSPKAVATIVKLLAKAVGIDPNTVGAHSLRAGLVTSALRAGKAEHAVMKHSRHTNVSVFRSYVREPSLFTGNVAAGLGL